MFRRNKPKPGAVTNDVTFSIADDYGAYIQSINAIVEARRRYDEQRVVLAECDQFVTRSNAYGNDQRLTIDGTYSSGIGNDSSNATLSQVQQIQLNGYLQQIIQKIEQELQQYYSLKDQLAKVKSTIRRAGFWTVFWIVGIAFVAFVIVFR